MEDTAIGGQRPWEDKAIRVHIMGRTYDGRTQQLEDNNMGGHSNWRTDHRRTQQLQDHHGRLQDTAWQDTGITGHIMGRHSKLYPSGIAWKDMP